MIPLKMPIEAEEAEIYLIKSFISANEANEIFQELRNHTLWRKDKITVFGKEYDQPRLTAWYATNEKSYSYSGIKMNPHPFTDLLKDLARRIEDASGIKFNTCLFNLYRDGKDSNGWHADDEKELGQNPPIASLSFGATRKFKMRKKDNHQQKIDLHLSNGSLLLMLGETQHKWQHQIPKTKKEVGERINLTFRIIE